MRRAVFGIWLLCLLIALPAHAAPGAWDTAYREFEGVGNDDALYLSVEVTQAPSIGAARLTFARWTGEEAFAALQQATEREAMAAQSFEHRPATVEFIGDEAMALETIVTEPTVTYSVATVFMRDEAVLYIGSAMAIGDTLGKPIVEIFHVLQAIEGRTGDHIRDLLPNVPDLLYPMHVVRTEIETPTPVGQEILQSVTRSGA